MTGPAVGTSADRASFLDDPGVDEHVERMYASDLSGQGYVAHLTRVWANSPEALAALSYVLKRASDTAGLDGRQRSLLVTACAATIGDSYCSLAWGRKLTDAAGVEVVRAVLSGDDGPLDVRQRALASWARKVAGAAAGTTGSDVEELRAAGFDDAQVVAVTVFVAQRMAFSTVNAALGAAPDVELGETVDPAVRDAVTWGRPIAAY
jgi:alkylhydroperoxidase family enzyme